ncbi:hypothetical protein MJO28_001555 [Puccinia striiformis f. sp. tritici]|uniref:Palmitoyltransferase n=3 Tax=Puccinia striiformis TaxID=27350 RepID=A0A0L0W581_9BASI|nr:hypothetical protein Pst134EA_003192 [Puccinia striiformis f. sp. tritici]KAI9624461.1 hypothetical protein H4Q26_016862 [Puccinia striiformis f. sp. tritici PST-130]KNF06622.1 hypothetical protein PSTG_00496 [Puccinia striiformis f. sp. tritici PST-78]POW19280.1 hypothetical protein PSHT_04816 [Puccinia striiformis]KAH9464739.1 hypothetical protein Pst134EB_004253 [Puccinia striiformis f. sp. tritici]KAH9472585.1 hypothetical protein Pst134EA_003192 [Puccinia striiformis f. sp. tritici]
MTTTTTRLKRLLKELPLLLVLIVLLWAQYTISISLILNYLILNRRLYIFSISIWIPFNLFWFSTIINLFRCIIAGPGWVENYNPTTTTYSQDHHLEQQSHKINRTAPSYDHDDDDEEDESNSDLEEDAEDGQISSIPLLSQNYQSSSTRQQDHLSRSGSLSPRPAITSENSPPSYLANPDTLRPSNLSFQEQVQRQQQSSSSSSLPNPTSDLLSALNFPPPPTLLNRRPNESSRRCDSLMCKSDGSLRFCRKCDHYKADRSHHCSSCGRCVLRMDHHCPWLGGRCVGLKNHKFFILFLSSSSITSIIAAIAAGKGLMDFVSNTRIDPADPFQLAPLNWAFLILVGGLFGMVLSGFTAYHLYLISVNRTTIENMERSVRIRPTGTRDPSESYVLLRTTRLRPFDGGSNPPPDRTRLEAGETETGTQAPKLPSYNLPIYKSDDQLSRLERRKLEAGATKLNLFDLGSSFQNFQQIFGVRSPVWHWFLPVHPKGISDGYQYPINDLNLHKLVKLTSEIRLLPNERSNELRFERP